MKERYTIVKEEFNTLTGETTVVINTACGSFSGRVKLDDVDAQYPSIYHANELALSKALRKYAKQMVVITREKLQPLKAIMIQCLWVYEHSDKTNIYSHGTYLIRKEIAKLEKELKLWKNRVDTITKSIEKRIATRDKLVKAYLDKNK